MFCVCHIHHPLPYNAVWDFAQLDLFVSAVNLFMFQMTFPWVRHHFLVTPTATLTRRGGISSSPSH